MYDTGQCEFLYFDSYGTFQQSCPDQSEVTILEQSPAGGACFHMCGRHAVEYQDAPRTIRIVPFH